MILVTYAMPEERPALPWSDSVVPVCTGIGKVLAVSQVAKHLSPTLEGILSVGFCGGLNGTRQGDIVLANATRQWDLSLSDLEISLGHGYAMNCPVRIPELSLRSVPNPVRGEIISGDRFVDQSVHIDKQAVGVDMETAALAVLACELGLPFVSLREVSDVADGPQEETHQQFLDAIRTKGPSYTTPALEILERGLSSHPPPEKLTDP